MKQTEENKQSLKFSWENINQSNIWAIEVPKGLRQKNIWRNSGRKILKLDENYMSTDSRNITNRKKTTRAHHIQKVKKKS